jgi:hypothetical protein
MNVYFVYRSHYEGPSGKHVRVLDGDSVLGWFQAAWEKAKEAEDISEWLKAELGCTVYGFSSLFEAAREESLPPPTSDRKLKSYLEEHLYVEGEIKFKRHALQVLTDDDEIELAYFFFDDVYLKENPGRADYLLHEDWRLPRTSGDGSYQPSFTIKDIKPGGNEPGATYLAFLAFYDSGNLTDLEDWGCPCRIQGVRIPQLCDYLRATTPDQDWPFELKLLRSRLTVADSNGDRLGMLLDRAARLPVLGLSGMETSSGIGLGTVEQARAAVEDALATISKGTSHHDPSKSLISVGDHVAQLCLHVGWEGEMYHQWIIFDDLWAGEHRDLAEGILRYAKRWDVLTV